VTFSFALTALSKVCCGMPSVNPDDNPAEGYRIQGERKNSAKPLNSQKQEENKDDAKRKIN